jgi:hypothetical protein
MKVLLKLGLDGSVLVEFLCVTPDRVVRRFDYVPKCTATACMLIHIRK